MPISAGNFIIRSAISEDLVLLPEGNSKAKNAKITAGAFSETDNQCYWKLTAVTIDHIAYWKIINILSGTSNGNLTQLNKDNSLIAVQSAYKATTSAWVIEDSGHTMIVNGASVATYIIKPKSDSNLFLTVPDDGGNLYLSAALEDNTRQEFYFEATTYYNKKLASPNQLTTDSEDAQTYIIHSGSTTFKPQWTTSNKSTVYEIRYRSRCYDMDGQIVPIAENDDGWTSWTSWTAILAEAILNKKKKYTGRMRAVSYVITTPDGVDNSTYSKAEIQVQLRLTSASNMNAYNTTGTITHGPMVNQIISQYCTPSLNITAAIYSPNGLALTYSTDYTISGSSVVIDSIKNESGDILIENYVFTGQEYTGDLYLNCDELYSVPQANTQLTIKATIIEENGFVSGSGTFILTCSYDSSYGLDISPIYVLTDRLTLLAFIQPYDVVQCFMETIQLDGSPRWVECDKILDSYYSEEDQQEYVVFEIVPPYNSLPNLMWVCVDSNADWTSSVVSPPNSEIDSRAYSWYWIDPNGTPNAAILKYQIRDIMKPDDTIQLSGNEFITTAREYPVYRYSKTVKRSLDIEGIILNTEEETYALRSAFEAMAVANHCIYRQPDGKWYQVAIQSISFSKEKEYVVVQIKQEAETR